MSFLVNLDVPDLELGVAFYTQGLGLTVGRKLGPDFIELLGSSSPIYLLVKREGTPPIAHAHAVPARSYARHWTPVHLDFVVDDIEAARTRAITAGAIAEGEITEHAYGRLALMADPFGHGFCFLQFTARGYDAIAR